MNEILRRKVGTRGNKYTAYIVCFIILTTLYELLIQGNAIKYPVEIKLVIKKSICITMNNLGYFALLS
jgi:hypothetical protein